MPRMEDHGQAKGQEDKSLYDLGKLPVSTLRTTSLKRRISLLLVTRARPFFG